MHACSFTLDRRSKRSENSCAFARRSYRMEVWSASPLLRGLGVKSCAQLTLTLLEKEGGKPLITPTTISIMAANKHYKVRR